MFIVILLYDWDYSLIWDHPKKTRRWTNAGLMLAHRLRRWVSMKAALVQRILFAVYFPAHYAQIKLLIQEH